MNLDIIRYIGGLINKDNPLIIEIGAYDGKDTRNFLSVFPKSKVFSFEPDPRNIKKIKELSENQSTLWGCGDRYKLIEEAISDVDGPTIFYESHGVPHWIKEGITDWSGSGSLNKPKEHLRAHPDIPFGKGVSVFGRRLDTFIKQEGIKNIDLIWADVNGAERKFLDGAKETLEITKYLYTECTGNMWEDGVYERDLVKLLPGFNKLRTNTCNVLFERIKPQ
jgi:FkbM family methyltransferase